MRRGMCWCRRRVSENGSVSVSKTLQKFVLQCERILRNKIYFLSIIVFLSTTALASTQTAAIKLSELLNQFTTFQAQFTQKTMDAEQHVLQRSQGEMMLMRPGRFRFETKNPTHQIVITNGKTLWVYDVDLKQATEQSMTSSQINPAKLLSGNIDHLLQQFTIHLIPHHGVLVFQLIPKKSHQPFRSVAMAFSQDKLRSMQIENNMEQTTVFDFSHIQLNGRLSPSLFEFQAAKGVDVLR